MCDKRWHGCAVERAACDGGRHGTCTVCAYITSWRAGATCDSEGLLFVYKQRNGFCGTGPEQRAKQRPDAGVPGFMGTGALLVR